MKKAVIGWALLTVGAALGADWPGTGLFTANSAADFGDGMTPFTFGQGILSYTGGDATVEVPLTFNPTAKRPATVRITDAAATLTVSGQVQQTSGAFIKDGPGTLRLTYPGFNHLGLERESENKDGTLIAWDATGAVTNYGYARFTLNEGRVIFDGGAAQSNEFSAIAWIGSRTQKDTRLDVKGPKFVIPDGNWFCISRGAGQTNNAVSSEVHLTDGASAVFAGGVVLNAANGTPGYYGRARLVVDNAAASVSGAVYVGEGAGAPEIVVTNHATFANVQNGWNSDSGVQLGRKDSPSAQVKVEDCSTFSARTLYVNKGSSLSVRNSTLKFDRTLTTATRSETQDAGAVTFENATLAPFNTAMMCDWFAAPEDVAISVFGTLAIDAPKFCGVGRTLKSGASGAAVTKTGAGYLTLPATALPVTASAGTLRMSVPTRVATNALTGTIATTGSAALEVAGGEALAAMTVNADAAKFEPLGLEAQRGGWTTTGAAHVRADGVLQLMDSNGGGSGTATLDAKIAVDRSFRLSFDAFEYHTSYRPADQFNIVFHEKTPSSYTSGGYGGPGTNSFGVCVDYYYYCMRFCRNGSLLKQNVTTNSVFGTGTDIYAGFDAKRRYTIDYDKAAETVTFTITFPNGQDRRFVQTGVNLETICGTNTAYLGFGANTGGSYGSYSVSDLRFEQTGTPDVLCVGGRKTLAAGETFTAKIAPTESQDAFLMGRLDYADGAKLCVSNVLYPNGQPVRAVALSASDPAQWKLSNGAYWRADGTLATSRKLASGSYQGGSATSVAMLPVLDDWTLDFDWALGDHTQGAPADYIAVALLNGANQRALHVVLRYYYDYTVDGVKKNSRKTHAFIACGNVNAVDNPQEEIWDASPVDFAAVGSAHIQLAYHEAASNLVMTLSQQDGARTFSYTFTNIVYRPFLGGASRAKLRFEGGVGGLFAENVVTGASFTQAERTAEIAAAKRVGSFGFERMAGTGTLVKTGPGDLALASTNNAAVALRLDEGGLTLRKTEQEPYTIRAGGWAFSHVSGRYYAPNGLQIGKIESSHSSNVHSRRRVRIDGDWRCSFSFWINSGNPADAFSFFIHNDPRGSKCGSGGTANACYSEIKNSVAVAWDFYPGAPDTLKWKMAPGANGSFSWANGASYSPLTLPGKTTDAVLTYDAASKTLTCVLTQGATSVTNTFANFDVAGNVKSPLAHLGFGVGCGGCQATPRITNFCFERLAKDDAAQTAPYLASLDVRADATVRLESALTNAVYTLAPAVTLADGTALRGESMNEPGTLACGTLTLGEGCTLGGDAATTLAPAALAGETERVTLDGATLAVSAATRAARTLKNSEITLANGARIAVGAGSILSVGKVFREGVRLGGGIYRAGEADWIASGAVSLGGGTIMLLR